MSSNTSKTTRSSATLRPMSWSECSATTRSSAAMAPIRSTADTTTTRSKGGSGADTLDGSIGIDTASYASSNAGVLVNLKTGVAGGGHAQGDVLTDIENLTGSSFSDMLGGSNGDDVILGGNGHDTICAGAGTDQIWGGAGDDLFVFDQLDQPIWVGGANFEWIGDFVAGGTSTRSISPAQARAGRGSARCSRIRRRWPSTPRSGP